MMTTPSPTPAPQPAGEAAVERHDLANGYVLMMAERTDKWRIVDPDGHDQGHIVSEPDQIAAFVGAMVDSENIAKIAARTTARLLERERLGRLVDEMIEHREHRSDTGVRCGIALAAITVKRGRHLTAKEQLRNLAAGLADGDEEGRTADEWFQRLTRPGAIGAIGDRTSGELRKAVAAEGQKVAGFPEQAANGASEKIGRPRPADTSVIGPVDGMNERHPEGSYFRLVVTHDDDTKRHSFLLSRGEAEALRDNLNRLLGSVA